MWRVNGALLLVCSALVALCIFSSPGELCPRTRRPARHSASFRHDGRCWRVQTCSAECGAALRDPQVLAQHGPSVRASGLLLHHRGEPTQTAVEEPCS